MSQQRYLTGKSMHDVKACMCIHCMHNAIYTVLTSQLNVVFQYTSPVIIGHKCLPHFLPALHIGSPHKHTHCSWSYTGGHWAHG